MGAEIENGGNTYGGLDHRPRVVMLTRKRGALSTVQRLFGWIALSAAFKVLT